MDSASKWWVVALFPGSSERSTNIGPTSSENPTPTGGCHAETNQFTTVMARWALADDNMEHFLVTGSSSVEQRSRDTREAAAQAGRSVSQGGCRK
jgi:hypothetical protein